MKTKKTTGRLLTYIILIFFAIAVLVPVAWVFFASIKENPEFYRNPWTLPDGFHWQNYVEAWQEASMGTYFFNSIIITVVGLAILLIVAIPAAYILARFDFPGKNYLNIFLRAGLFINLSYIVIPIFQQLLNLNRFFQIDFFLNNRFILALIYAATALPFTIYLLSNYFSAISKTYEEAAYLDGAGYFETLLKVMIPMAKPSIVTVILFNFFSFWNEYIMAQTILTDNALRTLPVGLINLQQASRAAANYGPMYASLVIVMLPTLILYIFVQKQLTEGMRVGGDKG